MIMLRLVGVTLVFLVTSTSAASESCEEGLSCTTAGLMTRQPAQYSTQQRPPSELDAVLQLRRSDSPIIGWALPQPQSADPQSENLLNDRYVAGEAEQSDSLSTLVTRASTVRSGIPIFIEDKAKRRSGLLAMPQGTSCVNAPLRLFRSRSATCTRIAVTEDELSSLCAGPLNIQPWLALSNATAVFEGDQNVQTVDISVDSAVLNAMTHFEAGECKAAVQSVSIDVVWWSGSIEQIFVHLQTAIVTLADLQAGWAQSYSIDFVHSARSDLIRADDAMVAGRPGYRRGAPIRLANIDGGPISSRRELQIPAADRDSLCYSKSVGFQESTLSACSVLPNDAWPWEQLVTSASGQRLFISRFGDASEDQPLQDWTQVLLQFTNTTRCVASLKILVGLNGPTDDPQRVILSAALVTPAPDVTARCRDSTFAIEFEELPATPSLAQERLDAAWRRWYWEDDLIAVVDQHGGLYSIAWLATVMAVGLGWTLWRASRV